MFVHVTQHKHALEHRHMLLLSRWEAELNHLSDPNNSPGIQRYRLLCLNLNSRSSAEERGRHSYYDMIIKYKRVNPILPYFLEVLQNSATAEVTTHITDAIFYFLIQP
jgi:hypothetical protein